MTSDVRAVQEYLDQLAEDRREVVDRLRETLAANIIGPVEEEMWYGVISYVVSRDRYPAGHHCNPNDDLQVMGIASQKGCLSVCVSPFYLVEGLRDWLLAKWPSHCSRSRTWTSPASGSRRWTTFPLGFSASCAGR